MGSGRKPRPGDAVWRDELLLGAARERLGALPEPALTHLAQLQVRARESGYAQSHPGAREQVLWQAGNAVGIMLIDQSDDPWWLVDFLVAADSRGRGTGGQALAELCALADAACRPIALHVRAGSPAIRLYLRSGFREVRSSTEPEQGADLFMLRPVTNRGRATD